MHRVNHFLLVFIYFYLCAGNLIICNMNSVKVECWITILYTYNDVFAMAYKYKFSCYFHNLI